MKRLLMAVAAVLVMAAPSYAQMGGFGMPGNVQKVNVDTEGVMKKITKAEKDMAKKATKSSTWINYGKAMLEAHTVYSKNVYDGLNTMSASVMFGEPTSQEDVVVGGVPMVKITYTPEFVAYADANGNISGWEFPVELVPGALDKAIEAYNKAMELDPKAMMTVMGGLSSITDALLKDAGNAYGAGLYNKAGDLFKKAYEVSDSPAMLNLNFAALYNAGLSYFFGESYEAAHSAFKGAAEGGFEQDGDAYYFQYQALKEVASAEDEINEEVLAPAKDMLMAGFEKYPENAKIIECLTDYYVSMGEDPAAVIPMVEEAIAKDPTNPSLWNGLGRIQNGQGDIDGALESFIKVAELLPENDGAQYSVGYLYISKADKMFRDANAKTYSGQAEYDAALKEVNQVYAKSIEPLEKAHALNPTDKAYVEYLRSVCFRLRDMEGMMDKYNKYNELLKTM